MATKLTRVQERAISALMISPTVADAAGRINVHPNTLRDWMKRADFSQAYKEARQELLDKTIERLQHATFATLDALVNDLTNPDASVRQKAAELILETTVKGTESLKFGEMVKELERRTANSNGTTPRYGLRELPT